MKPVAELCPEEEAHPFVCGLTVAHFDAWLRMSEEARRFWDHHVQAELHGRGIDALVTLAPA